MPNQDTRFNHLYFQVQPIWVIKQALANYRSQVNTSHISQARLLMMTANINRSDKVPPFEDISEFLPYPSQFLIDTTDLLFKIEPNVATEFLDSYESFDPEVELAFTGYMKTIKVSLLLD